MATVTATRTTGRVTLSGTTIDTVTISQGPFDVCNWTGSADLTVTYALNNAPTDPVAGAAETFAVPAGTSRRIDAPSGSVPGTVKIKVLGNGNVYSVDGAG